MQDDKIYLAYAHCSEVTVFERTPSPEVEELRAACEHLIANLPDEIFEWIGDSISWSNVSAIKNARDAAEAAIAKAKED